MAAFLLPMIVQTILGYKLDMQISVDKTYPKAKTELVSYKGEWKPSYLKKGDINIGSFRLEFERGETGADRDSVIASAKIEAAQLGCDNFFFLFGTAYPDTDQAAAMNFQCTRSANYEQMEQLLSINKELQRQFLTALDMEQKQEYEAEIRETSFGNKWVDFWEENLSSGRLQRELKGKFKSAAPEKERERTAAEIFVQRCADFVQANLKLYKKDYARLMEIQHKHANRPYGLFVFPTLNEKGRINLSKYRQDVLLLAYQNKPTIKKITAWHKQVSE